MKVIVANNPTIASRHAASIITQQLHKKPNTTFLLPTGSTPLPLYQLLTEKVKTEDISFAHTKTFNLDEYLGLETTHPQSYHHFMHKNLFNKINIRKNNISIPSSKPKNPQFYCKKYDAKIAKYGIDLAIIGIGQNGHLAFNEPGTSFSSKTHVTNLSSSTIKANSRFFSSTKQVPQQAITVGLDTIMSANKIILLAFGKNKAQAISSAMEGNITEQVPASILQKHKDVTIILDSPAAKELKKTRLHPPELGGIKLYSDFNLPRNKKIAFFSPHPDDAAICSGAILSTLSKNNQVHEIIVTTGHHAINTNHNLKKKIEIREKEALEESKILGTKIHYTRCRFYDNGTDIHEPDLKKIRELMHKIQPDIAFVPQKADSHPTHSSTRKIALASLPHNIDLWSFETPWSLFSHKKFNAVFEFSESLMKKNLEPSENTKVRLNELVSTQLHMALRNFAK
jgi:glucosamine-6-phosphate deaminase